MDLSALADWLTIIFFLWFGLKYFVPTLDKGVIGAIIALATAIITIFTV